jgi:hypothetical protein
MAVVNIRPMRMGVNHRLVFVQVAVPDPGRHSGMGMQMVAVVMTVPVLVKHGFMLVPVGVALMHKQSDRRGKEQPGDAVGDLQALSEPCHRQRYAEQGRAGERYLRACRAERLG